VQKRYSYNLALPIAMQETGMHPEEGKKQNLHREKKNRLSVVRREPLKDNSTQGIGYCRRKHFLRQWKKDAPKTITKRYNKMPKSIYAG
jgi:hypothetical protein